MPEGCWTFAGSCFSLRRITSNNYGCHYRRVVELARVTKTTAKGEQVNEVVAVMQNSPTAAYLRDCSFHERMMLASLVKCVKREGVEEIKWGEVK